MNDWKRVTLGEICSIEIGGTPSRSEERYWWKSGSDSIPLPWVSISDMKSKIIADTKESITEIGASQSNCKHVPKGTLLMSFKLTIGRLAFAGRDLYTNEAISAIKPIRDICPEFLYYGLQHWNLTGDSDQAVKGVTLNKQKLQEIPCLLPPLPEQKKIAEILSGIDSLITNQEKKLRALENLQIALIEDIALGKNEKGARKQTDIGECPTYWESVQLGEVAEFANGNSFKSADWAEGGYPIIRIQNLNGGTDFNYFNGEVNAKWFVPSGTLLFSWSGQRGKSFGPFIWSGVDGVLNQHIFKVSHSEKIYQPFLYLLLKMVQIKTEREAHGFKDSFMHVKKSEITSTSVGIPSIARQKELAAAYEQICQQIILERRKTASFVNLKSSCSSDLLSGRKRVSV